MLPKLTQVLFAALVTGACLPSAMAAPAAQWTWEAGKQTNNGAITIKSVSGGSSYSGTQNPTGAVAKTNQNAVTQPPTVILQATGTGFDYDHCFIFQLPGYATKFIGYGSIDGTNKFTGVASYLGSISASTAVLELLRPPSLAPALAMTLYANYAGAFPASAVHDFLTGTSTSGYTYPLGLSDRATSSVVQCYQ